MDVVPTTAGIPSTLTHYRGTTVNFNRSPAVIPQIPLPCHSLLGIASPWRRDDYLAADIGQFGGFDRLIEGATLKHQ